MTTHKINSFKCKKIFLSPLFLYQSNNSPAQDQPLMTGLHHRQKQSDKKGNVILEFELG